MPDFLSIINMYSLIILLLFTGTYFIYCSSQKMKNIHLIEKSMFKSIKPTQFKIIGIMILITTAVLTMYKQGIEAGALAFVVYIMASFSLINLIFPYKTLNWKHVMILFTVSLTLEILF